MQVNSTHKFLGGETITFNLRPIPIEDQVATRCVSGRPFEVKSHEIISDVSVPVSYTVVSASIKDKTYPTQLATSVRVGVASTPVSHIPFDYQHLDIRPNGYLTNCSINELQFDAAGEENGEDEVPIDKRYTSMPWFIDTTTMAVRRVYDGAATHYIDQLFIHTN